MGELAGRVALVTGTAHGIGTAIADGLEEDGATVHRVDRDTADLSDPEQVAKLVARIGRIDILVNNAGGVCGQVGRPLEEVPDEDWQAILDANLTSTFVCTRAVAPGFVLSNPATRRQWESYGPEGQRALVERIATRRVGTPEDIANGVLFFAT